MGKKDHSRHFSHENSLDFKLQADKFSELVVLPVHNWLSHTISGHLTPGYLTLPHPNQCKGVSSILIYKNHKRSLEYSAIAHYHASW